MYTLVVILILIVSVLLGLIVLVQNSKGGGLVSNFGGANQMMGVRQTTDFLEKATPKGNKEGTPKSEVSSQIETVLPSAPATEAPAATMEAPATTEAPAEQE